MLGAGRSAEYAPKELDELDGLQQLRPIAWFFSLVGASSERTCSWSLRTLIECSDFDSGFGVLPLCCLSSSNDDEKPAEADDHESDRDNHNHNDNNQPNQPNQPTNNPAPRDKK